MNRCFSCCVISFHSAIFSLKENHNFVIRQAFVRYILWLLVISGTCSKLCTNTRLCMGDAMPCDCYQTGDNFE